MLSFFFLVFLGVNLTFFPLHFAGLQGYPRKYLDYSDINNFWNILSSLGSFITIFSIFLFIYMLFESFFSFRRFFFDDKTGCLVEYSNSGYVFGHSYVSSFVFFFF